MFHGTEQSRFMMCNISRTPIIFHAMIASPPITTSNSSGGRIKLRFPATLIGIISSEPDKEQKNCLILRKWDRFINIPGTRTWRRLQEYKLTSQVHSPYVSVTEQDEPRIDDLRELFVTLTFYPPVLVNHYVSWSISELEHELLANRNWGQRHWFGR